MATGIETSVSFDGVTKHRGTWARLLDASLVPKYMIEPPLPRRGGNWFRAADGNSWVISGPVEGIFTIRRNVHWRERHRAVHKAYEAARTAKAEAHAAVDGCPNLDVTTLTPTSQEGELLAVFRQLGPILRTGAMQLLRETLMEQQRQTEAFSEALRNIHRGNREENRPELWEDPGVEEMQRRAAHTPARFNIGEEALYFAGNDEYGTEVTVVKDYAIHPVLAEDGHYWSDGKRIDYLPGYVVRLNGEDRTSFCSAHQLTRADCRPAHLHLVRCR